MEKLNKKNDGWPGNLQRLKLLTEGSLLLSLFALVLLNHQHFSGAAMPQHGRHCD